MTVGLIEETEPLGTAGALGRLNALGREILLVVNGDVITDIDYAALHDSPQAARHQPGASSIMRRSTIFICATGLTRPSGLPGTISTSPLAWCATVKTVYLPASMKSRGSANSLPQAFTISRRNLSRWFRMTGRWTCRNC